MNDGQKVLIIEHLNKNIEGRDILTDININFFAGKIYGLLGQNGAGKTTLMKCILGLNHIKGNIVFDDVDITNGKNEIKRTKVGNLIETPYFSKNYTVEQVLREQLTMTNVEVDNTYLTQITDILALSLKMNVKTKKLSLGWKQKLGIARAMYNFPQLLLLDEPFNGLDPTAVQQVEELIKILVNRGTCIIISSHILDELQNIADELFLVKDAKISCVDKNKVDKQGLKDYYLNQFTN